MNVAEQIWEDYYSDTKESMADFDVEMQKAVFLSGAAGMFSILKSVVRDKELSSQGKAMLFNTIGEDIEKTINGILNKAIKEAVEGL